MDLCSAVRRNLHCSYRLELLVAKLLLIYAETLRSSSPKELMARAILTAIAIESNRHAELIDSIAKLYNLYEEAVDCPQIVGMPWTVIQKLFEEISSGRHIDLKDFIERQAWIERTVGEETYHRLLIPLLREGVKSGCIDSDSAPIVGVLLDKIVFDEEWHEKLLRRLLEL